MNFFVLSSFNTAEASIALCHAARTGSLEAVRYLVERRGAQIIMVNSTSASTNAPSDSNVRDKKDKATVGASVNLGPIIAAARHVAVVRYLLDRAGSDISVVDEDGCTILMHMVRVAAADVMESVLDAVVRASHTDSSTGAHTAAARRASALDCPALRTVDKRSRNALMHAAEAGNFDAVRLLISPYNSSSSNRKQLKPSTQQVLLHAAPPSTDDSSTLQPVTAAATSSAVPDNATSNISDTDPKAEADSSPLTKHDLSRVTMAAVDVNSRCSAGLTALRYAAGKGHWRVVRYLVENAKADTEAVDAEHGYTALFLAALTVGKAADPSGRKVGEAESSASDHAHATTSVLLPNAVVPVPIASTALDQKLPLLRDPSTMNIVEFLVLCGGANVHAVASSGDTILLAALKAHRWAVCAFLLDHLRSTTGVEPLNTISDPQSAVIRSSPTLPSLRDIAKRTVEAADCDGNTAFMVAARLSQHALCKRLADELGANVNARNLGGRTAVMEAAMEKRMDTLIFLIKECRANVEVTGT